MRRCAVPPALGAALPTPQLKGTAAAAYDVAERLIPGSKAHFKLSIVGGCAGGTPDEHERAGWAEVLLAGRRRAARRRAGEDGAAEHVQTVTNTWFGRQILT